MDYEGHTQRHRDEGHVKKEAEICMIWLQTKDPKDC